ncbi:MAG: MATE family efflux transporter [Planctomycetota bacterium]
MRNKPKSILTLAWPLVISFTMRSLFNFVDTFYAAEIGDAAIAAIGLTIPLEFMFIATWVGLSNALTSLLGKAMGAREPVRIAQLVRVSYKIIRVILPSFLFLGGVVCYASPHLGFNAEVGYNLAIYAGTITAGMGLTGFWSIVPDSIVKAHHDTRSTMVAGILSNVVNVALNTLFLFVFHWGIFGIAFSTVLSKLAGLAYAMLRARSLETSRERSWGRAPMKQDTESLYRHPTRRLLLLGLPSSVGFLLMSLESGIVAGLLRSLPETTPALAAWSIYFRFVMFGLTPMIAGSVAMLPYVARAFGEGNLPHIRAGFRTMLIASFACVTFLVAPVYFQFAGPIVGYLSNDPATISLSVFSLKIAPLACLAATPMFICRPLFEGMQRSVPGMIAALVRYVGLTLPMGYLGMRIAQANGYGGYQGVIAGLIGASALTSIGFMAFALRAVRGAERMLVRDAMNDAKRRQELSGQRKIAVLELQKTLEDSPQDIRQVTDPAREIASDLGQDPLEPPQTP